MKKPLITLLFLLLSVFGFAQEINYKTYSYSEFFKLIEEEKDSVFKLDDALIEFNKATDSSLYVYDNFLKDSVLIDGPKRSIDKHIELRNVQFIYQRLNSLTADLKKDLIGGVIHNVEFKKSVKFDKVLNARFYNCIFQGDMSYDIKGGKDLESIWTNLRDLFNRRSLGIVFQQCNFYGSVEAELNVYPLEPLGFQIVFKYNTFYQPETTPDLFKSTHDFFVRRAFGFTIENNTFLSNDVVGLTSIENQWTTIVGNKFDKAVVDIRISEIRGFKELEIAENYFGPYVGLNLDQVVSKNKIPWNQFSGKLFDNIGYYNYYQKKYSGIKAYEIRNYKEIEEYFNNLRYRNKEAFKTENSLKSRLLNHYRSKLDTEDANAVFVEVKNMETERLKHLYQTNPNFKTFFTLKINQFLKVFSAYGTEPARAIIFSVYVILAFALIYLFFPNSWDKHGRNRFVDRYTFFLKYMKKDAGIHEVYLEDKQAELMQYDEYKKLVLNSEKSVPKFFSATALPLYKWAISSTKMHAAFLSKIDIMKGTWQDLPPKKRFLKSVLLVGAFLMALVYDLLIKILNALMLSINTFTTLGFGEIPIKGLPRYLAIIQGFIGWFMLTIFSVSLISQLLN